MKKLIQQDGQIAFGVYESAPEHINYLDFDLRNNMDRPFAMWRKKMRFNQFQFMSLTGHDFVLGVAIVNLKWVSNCFVYLYQPSTKTFKEFSWLQPFAHNTLTSTQPNHGTWSFKKGKNIIEMVADEHERHLSIHIANELNVNVTMDNQQKGLNVCCRAGYNGWVFTHKNTALTCQGYLKWQGHDIDVSQLKASVDWSCGHMRRETFWNWASMSHETQNGDIIGFNLAAGVNETSYTENMLWVNQQPIKLERAEFVFQRRDRMKPWLIKSSDGLIDLTFTPEGERKEKINVGFIASNFTQVFGCFNGTIKTPKGEVHKIEQALGFCEDHFAKW